MSDNGQPDPEHDPDTCNECGIQHAQFTNHTWPTLDTAAVLAELYAEPLSDELAGVVALTHAFRSNDTKAALRLVMYLMRDRDGQAVCWQLAQACQLLAQICNEQRIGTETFGRWAQIAAERG